jgi:pyruvate/2-oxoglutarate dehydrogenase complex dihydrolipoamide acyltransferase (E2) component
MCKAIASVTIDGPSTGVEDDITFSMRIGQDGDTLSVGQMLKKASVRHGHVADIIRRMGDGIAVSYVRNGGVVSTSMGFAGDAAIRDIDGYTNTHGTAGDVALLLCGNILEGGLNEKTPRSRRIKTMRKSVQREWHEDTKRADSAPSARLLTPLATPEKATPERAPAAAPAAQAAAETEEASPALFSPAAVRRVLAADAAERKKGRARR